MGTDTAKQPTCEKTHSEEQQLEIKIWILVRDFHGTTLIFVNPHALRSARSGALLFASPVCLQLRQCRAWAGAKPRPQAAWSHSKVSPDWSGGLGQMPQRGTPGRNYSFIIFFFFLTQGTKIMLENEHNSLVHYYRIEQNRIRYFSWKGII